MSSKLFQFLDAVDAGNFDFVDNLSDDEVKEIQPYVALGWLHGSKVGRVEHVLLTDTYVNLNMFNLGRHPRLILQTMIASNCGLTNGGSRNYSYVRSNGAKKTKEILAVAKFYDVTASEAEAYVRILGPDEVKEIVKQVEDL